MRVAFLGLGQMGAAIAQRVVEKGHDVTVWNRSPNAANAIVDSGAKAAESAAQAVSAAEVVFSMLFDDGALEDVMFTQGTLQAMRTNAIHVSLSTISVALAERLEAEHAKHGQRFVSAPVFGRPGVAAEGKLWLVLAGANDALAEVGPVLETFSRGSTVVGVRPSQANAVKLGGNFMISSMIAAFSEAITVAESQGVDGAVFVETINNALFQSPFVAGYGNLMLTPPKKPGATITLGVKDTRLFREVAEAGEVSTPLAELFQERLQNAVDAGRGDEDWAAGYLAQTRADAGR